MGVKYQPSFTTLLNFLFFFLLLFFQTQSGLKSPKIFGNGLKASLPPLGQLKVLTCGILIKGLFWSLLNQQCPLTSLTCQQTAVAIGRKELDKKRWSRKIKSRDATKNSHKERLKLQCQKLYQAAFSGIAFVVVWVCFLP